MLHSFLITGLTWLYINSWFVFGIEEGVITKLQIFRNFLFASKKLPSSAVLLVNTSKDISLAKDPAEYGDLAITDRFKLLQFLQRIDTIRPRPEFILCDLLFDIKTPCDSMIQLELNKIRNIVIPYPSTEGRITTPVLKAATGLAQYATNNGSFIKMPLIGNDSLKSLPVLMDEMINKKHYSHNRFFTFCDRTVSLNYIIPDYYIRPFEFLNDNKYPFLNLGELVDPSMDDQSFKEYVGNRYVMIGNFYNDIHATPIGRVPGPVILFDSFLSLQYNRHTISIGWVLLLIIYFAAISYIAFYCRLPKWHLQKQGILSPLVESLVSKYLSFFGMILLLSLISLFVFGIPIGILIVSLYFSLINYISQKKIHDQND